MSSEVIAAIIGTLGAIVGSCIALRFNNENLLQSIQADSERLEKTLKNEIIISSKALSLQYITDKRVDWIYAVRDELSGFISLVLYIADKHLVSMGSEDISLEYSRELNQYMAKLRLLFNFSGERDKKILELIDSLIHNLKLGKQGFKRSRFEEEVTQLTRQSQIYLKLEWERVKLETIQDISIDDINKTLENKSRELENNSN